MDRGIRRQKPKSHEFLLQIPCEIQTVMWGSLYIISIWYAQGGKRVNLEKAECRSVRQRRLREEEKKEKLQKRADIWGKLANIQFDKLRKLELPYQVAAW